MPQSAATASWFGTLKEGNGTVSSENGALNTPYTFATRFGDQAGANPEEMISAAVASCYSMALSAELEKAGHPVTEIKTSATTTIKPSGEGFAITGIAVQTVGKVPGVEDATFQQIAAAVKEGCPVAKALLSVNITLDAKLVSE